MTRKLAIVGYGRSGKDTAGLFLGQITHLNYVGSTSDVVRPLIAKDLGISEEEAWATRHQNREYWKKWCDNYRKDDPAKIAKESLKHGDMVVGIRGREELEAVQAQGLVDLTIWIANPRVEKDPTVDFEISYADIVIYNDSDYATFYKRLRNFAKYACLIAESKYNLY